MATATAFPGTIIAINTQSEANDVGGALITSFNNAADYNSHDQEIRALETFLVGDNDTIAWNIEKSASATGFIFSQVGSGALTEWFVGSASTFTIDNSGAVVLSGNSQSVAFTTDGFLNNTAGLIETTIPNNTGAFMMPIFDGAAPSAGVATRTGGVCYRPTTDTLYVYDGTAWQAH